MIDLKRKRSIIEILVAIGYFIVIIATIIIITLVMLSQLSPKDICEGQCKLMNGTYWMTSDCDGSVINCSGTCDLNNGTTLTCKQILDNITSMIDSAN